MTVAQHSFGFAAEVDEPGPMTSAHRHDDVELNVGDADVTYLLSGTRTRIPAHRVAVFWAARPHQLIDVEPGTHVSWLTVPLPAFLAWGLPDPFVSSLLAGRLVIPRAVDDPGGAGDLVDRFARWSRELGGPSAFVDRTARLEVEALVRRISLSEDAGRTTAPPVPGSTERVAAMAAFVAGHFAEPVGVADVAAHVHLHPGHAMALFKRVTGTSIGGYLAQCRLAEAQRLLVSSRLPVTDVALAAGFGSTSQFYERFRAAVGTTPSAYRRRTASVDDRALL
ncbi:AraC family transcriptional regulator [Curtobacterium sp. 'Ferrero']|uniref:helix-turn-helix domain-containing protein n=1 Tax=Curtobacterium sp. 'Ferrero' TaxID=2033654 RepID=UPI000BD86D0F|nr:helix-turn-helix domain-containing protein [Curtobacterium sp. 'Ferrero']PCN49155.1 AraC family transcriptional regulator [Curtobacterium sp. 'Ferrero']